MIEAVRLEIDTYLDFREHGDRVGGAARALHDKVLANILTRSPAEIGIVPVDGARPRDVAYAPEAWEDVATQLDAGAVEFIDVSGSGSGRGHGGASGQYPGAKRTDLATMESSCSAICRDGTAPRGTTSPGRWNVRDEFTI